MFFGHLEDGHVPNVDRFDHFVLFDFSRIELDVHLDERRSPTAKRVVVDDIMSEVGEMMFVEEARISSSWSSTYGVDGVVGNEGVVGIAGVVGAVGVDE